MSDMKNKTYLSPFVLGEILFRKEKRLSTFLGLTLSKKVQILRTATYSVKKDILTRIPIEELVSIIESVDPDEATDYIQSLSKKRREKLMYMLGREIRDSISKLLEFDPRTAAGLMTLDYIQVETDDEISTVVRNFKSHENKTSRAPIILITKDLKLIGHLPVHKLVTAKSDDIVAKHIKTIPTISYAANHKKVIEKFRGNPHKKIVVVNDDDTVIGVIFSDDVLKIIDDRTSSSLYDFAGVSLEESVTDGIRRKIGFRYKWLMINLVTTFFTAYTVSYFEDTISKHVLLAVYMPIVAGMGGNAATQTLAVMVRGITLNQISFRTTLRVLKNEVCTGFTNGLINGLLVAAVVMVINKDPVIAFILGIAMVANLVVAAFFGTIVPFIVSKIGKDPASSATIFITTATDVLGFLTFLGLASLFLS